MRRGTYKSVSKATAVGANVITFSGTDIPMDRAVKLMIGQTGAGNNNGQITNILLLANNQVVFNGSFTQLQAFLQAAFPNKTPPGTANVTCSIPFYIPDLGTEEEQDQSQFPFGASATLRITTAGTAAVGTFACAVEYTDQPQVFFPSLYGTPMQCPASSQRFVYTITDGGILRGLALNTVGLDEVILYVNDKLPIFELPGPTNALGVDMYSEYQSETGGATITVIRYVRVPMTVPMSPLAASLKLSTTGTWGGTSNECFLHVIRPIAELSS